MKDNLCVIEVGTHTEPYWKDKTRTGFVVCNRHKEQYDNAFYIFVLESFDWEELSIKKITRVVTCKLCSITESRNWWKCCPTHTTEQGPDVVCQDCAKKCSLSK